MQLEIMLFFQSVQNGFLTALANFFSFFGEEVAMILILLSIYWCINKKKGFILFCNLMTSLMCMQILKAIFRVPRPFVKHPELIDAGRVETATGYSFPSGHSTGASAFFGSLYRLFSSKTLKVICIVFIICVPISRLYLGVHWPTDVIVGTAIGLFFVFVLTNALSHLFENKKELVKVTLRSGIAISAISLIAALALHFLPMDETAFSDLMKNMAVLGTALIGMGLEEKHVKFKTDGTLAKKILRLVLGLAVIVLFQAMKFVFPENLYYPASYLRYSLIGIWATYLFPLIAIKAGLMESENVK